ncbi:hypothetical protein CBR_g54773 [Chara braunii]|uniref:DDE Tnp4 domain-containing protein n=1 Tax=Chara braunii TaxID=69332 RepID=A0A388MCD5_CHABU|nr:hypothetical protein CBR_g54773 [Chara braunii]|eukprot:GBG92230.1 hypothetical protein CBR_g54773 [Chara braunii]
MEDIQFSSVAADGSAQRRRKLSEREKRLVVTALLAMWTHLQHTAALRRGAARRTGMREAMVTHAMADLNSSAVIWDAAFLMANAIVLGLVAFALYRWASGEAFESAMSSFGMGQSSGIKAVRDMTNPILSAYPDKIRMLTARRLLQVARVFAAKGFPNCFGCMDYSHVYVDKPTNAPVENYFDRKQQYFVIAQVAVDLDMFVLDVYVGYSGSVHDARVLINSLLHRRVEVGTLFLADAVDLPYGVRTRGYVLAGNDYGPLPLLVVPYGGVVQPPNEAHFDTCHKSSRNVVEREFGRLKGMWRLFLGQHKTNMENLPQQFTAVYILHNLLIDVGIESGERLLVDRDFDDNERPINLGMHELAAPVSQDDATDDALALRGALSFRMHSAMV